MPNAITPNLTSPYGNRPTIIPEDQQGVSHFDQTSISFACTSNDIAPVAVGCIIVANGYKYKKNEVVQFTLIYDPTGLPLGKTFKDDFVSCARIHSA